MERELEALAARPESPGEPPFQALVEAAGGRGQVLLPGSSLAVQAAACRALQAAGPWHPAEGAWERPGLPALLACFSWGPWSRGKNPDTSSRSGPAQGDLRDSEEELVLTAVYPNGDCEDPGEGSEPCDRIASAPTEPAGDLR
ncbi:hypothetical protein E5288_WYG000395 [Bos mutus]|uniref:C2orf72-like C-terminal domain-containing protein n=1 Tax=Bos mutus TaxID=72004 RepID=A0A6B0QQU7_9CETA|nr:hypothetical protein [Bos mutus]